MSRRPLVVDLLSLRRLDWCLRGAAALPATYATVILLLLFKHQNEPGNR